MLYKLHQLDAAMLEIKSRAAALDPGKQIAALIKQLSGEYDTRHKKASALRSEQMDLELRQKSISEKIKSFNEQLYGGSVVNSKEAAAIEAEIAALKDQQSINDEHLLQLWELVPPAMKEEDEIKTKLERAKQLLATHQKQAKAEHEKLQQEYKTLASKRPGLLQETSPALLNQYNVIRERHGGIGMAEVTPKKTCQRCGVLIPEKALDALKLDKLVTCESCKRILFWVAPS